MVVKSELKLIRSLQQKKYRNEHGLFVIEGKKAVEELLESDCRPFKILVSGGSKLDVPHAYILEISSKELKQLSGLKSPNGVLGVFHMMAPQPIDFSDWILMLDGVQDPGNLGTIIRLCDWFGIRNLICSPHTVDCYNPKVLQATMGSIARVNITYTDLEMLLKNNTLPVFGTFMNGTSVYKSEFPDKGILVMGNEGNGISELVKKFCDESIAIPQYGTLTTESLNVGTATAILLSEIRRNK